MSPRTVERVDDWEAVSFGGGYGGLRDLASGEFSGVVTTGPTRLFMIRGTVVGVLDGSIDDFEDADGSARQAPHPALPLLAVMQERSDEVRAKYYTEDTPIADVDRTLADGSFTGYVELSENVLSGDYYQVYHQGRSMSVAYVGASERLLTDDEAFDQADDEVGIYEVRPVDIEAIPIPDPAGDDGSTTSVPGESPDGAATDPSDGAAVDPSPDAGAGSTDDAASPSEPAPGEGAASTDAPDTTATADADARADDDTGVEAGSAAATDTSSSPATSESGAASEGSDARSRSETSGGSARSNRGDAHGETDPSEASSDAGAGTTGESRAPADEAERSGDTDSRPNSKRETSSEPDREGSPDRERSTGSAERSPASRQSSADQGASERSADSAGAEPTTGEQSAGANSAGARSADAGTDSGRDTTRTEAARRGSETAQQPTETAQQSTGAAQGTGSPSAGGTATDLEVRSIPSLDPSLTEAASASTSGTAGGSNGSSPPSTRSRPSGQPQRTGSQGTESRDRGNGSAGSESDAQSSPGTAEQPSPEAADASAGQSDPSGDRSNEATPDSGSDGGSAEEADDGAAEELRRELESREEELTDLRTDLERVEAERDELENTTAELEAERDRLETELEEARAEIERLSERLEDAGGPEADGTAAKTQIGEAEAVDNTNLFVRYRSKGDATLQTAHDGNADRDAVTENLRLEYHTQFDAESAAVGDESFDSFLTGTIQYRFVEWLVESLIYEVRDTGHADAMADLYNALPKIDRAELNGQVSVNYTEDGEEHRSQERFDVVVRDRMGNPLVVANINDSRDPATDAMMTDLVTRAERVGESGESLAGAFLVTESFFEPGALETAEEATSNGLFSRDKRKSFVNLSRKGGYHLCLIEARNQEFHLAVPEL